MKPGDDKPEDIGTWTITVKGGPAFWGNVVAAITAAAGRYQLGGPIRDCLVRLTQAKTEYEEPT